jgi:hypothetical protein
MSTTPLSIWRRILRRLGRTGVAATALLAVSVALLATLPHFQKQTRALQTAQAEQAERMASKSVRIPVRQVPLGEQIDRFVTAFPQQSQHADDLQAVFSAAEKKKLKLPRGEYQFRNDANARLVTVTASFPVTADYGTVKAFTAEVLKSVPHASLDELRMNRESAGSQVLESWIRFSFVYRRS